MQLQSVLLPHREGGGEIPAALFRRPTDLEGMALKALCSSAPAPVYLRSFIVKKKVQVLQKSSDKEKH